MKNDIANLQPLKLDAINPSNVDTLDRGDGNLDGLQDFVRCP